MDKLVVLDQSNVKKILNKRVGESKFGEHVQLLTNVSSIYDTIKNLDVTYVVFGIKESVGVFANYGKPGTSRAWEATLKVLLNTQKNHFINPEKVLILGHLDFPEYESKLDVFNSKKKSDIETSRKYVSEIDKHVSDLVYKICDAGKIPIIIGGGHNNAYGNIKGTSLALKKPIHAINFDAHTDFRALEGRHSGNGFSYAATEGFLKNYFVFGLHENYTSQTILEDFKSNKMLDYVSYEDMLVRKNSSFKKSIYKAKQHVCNKPFGIEIDCDAIEHIPSSAMTPSGFSVEKSRQFVSQFAEEDHVKYLHICEAAPKKKQDAQVGKLITYLITDFIKAHGR